MSDAQTFTVDPALAAVIDQFVNARLADMQQELVSRQAKEHALQSHIDTLSESLATALAGSGPHPEYVRICAHIADIYLRSTTAPALTAAAHGPASVSPPVASSPPSHGPSSPPAPDAPAASARSPGARSGRRSGASSVVSPVPKPTTTKKKPPSYIYQMTKKDHPDEVKSFKARQPFLSPSVEDD